MFLSADELLDEKFLLYNKVMSVLKRIVTSHLQCVISKHEQGKTQYIIAVSKKVQKSAVKRNRVKRIIRAALQQILPTLPSSLHFFIVVKKDCSMKKSSDMVKELEILKTI